MRANVHHVSCRARRISTIGRAKAHRIPASDCFRGLARDRTLHHHAHPVSRNFRTRYATRLRRRDPVWGDWCSTPVLRPTERKGKACRVVSLIERGRPGASQFTVWGFGTNPGCIDCDLRQVAVKSVLRDLSVLPLVSAILLIIGLFTSIAGTMVALTESCWLMTAPADRLAYLVVAVPASTVPAPAGPRSDMLIRDQHPRVAGWGTNSGRFKHLLGRCRARLAAECAVSLMRCE